MKLILVRAKYEININYYSNQRSISRRGLDNNLLFAFALAQGGEFALVLFALAKGMALLDETLFQQLLIVVFLSMLATPALEKLAYRIFSTSRKSIKTKPDADA